MVVLAVMAAFVQVVAYHAMLGWRDQR